MILKLLGVLDGISITHKNISVEVSGIPKTLSKSQRYKAKIR